MVDSTKILYGRYKSLLNDLDIELVCDYLEQRKVLSSQDVEAIVSDNEETGKKRKLAMALCNKGSSKLAEISSLLRKFKSTSEASPVVPEATCSRKEGKVELLSFISQLKLFLTENHGPSWLIDDVLWDSLSDYFPPGTVRGVAHKSVSMRLSVLLEAFQQFVGNESMEAQRRVQDLERLLEKSEERCKQLVVVTQEWAIECGDKDKSISVYETEVKQLKATVAQLEKRVIKYKRFWQDNRSGDQFEEIRTELAERKELCTKLFEDKTKNEKQIQQLSQENKHLCTTIESLKDHITELEDRLGNMKLQATVKEPTVREMSHLVTDLRECQAQNQQLLDEKKDMEDQILALQIALAEYQGVDEPPSPPPRPKPTRTQAMVTGFRPRQYHKVGSDLLKLDGASIGSSMHDDTESTSSEETLPSSEIHSFKSMDFDPPPKNHESYNSESFSLGLPDGDYTLGTRYPNHSSVKIAPLDEEPPKYGVANKEKMCPVCHRSFMALSEREFQTHVAGCFK